MNTQIICFSPTGSTAKLTKKVAETIDEIYTTYDLTLQNNRLKYKNLTFTSNDLVIVGIPVYGGRIPQFLEEYFSSFRGNNTLAIFVVVYGNRNYDDALLELKNIFEAGGFKGIAAGAFIAQHSYSSQIATGRPDIEDYNEALKFANTIKSKLGNISELENAQLNVKGNFPYKERGKLPTMLPQTDNNCTDCGKCAEVCPMEAIDPTNFRDIDSEKCIRCCRCVNECPENAKAIVHETFERIRNTLIQNYTKIRKNPELFYAN